MPRITRTALVPFSAEQMFDLVNDVNDYSTFLPGCVGSKVIEQSDSEMVASLDIAKLGIKKTFVTRNRLIVGRAIQMQLVNGPFKNLAGGWEFIPLDENACKIELNLEFEFSSTIVEMAFGKIFNELTANMVTAFTKRAKELYV